MLTVQDVYEYVNHRAPYDMQEDFDNSGLLVGSMTREVTGILVAMDCTQPVLDEAEALGANMLITHHPLMFSPRKRMTEDDYEGRLICRMVRLNMSMLSAHTNLDKAPGGVTDVLARQCGLTECTGAGFIRAGDLPEAMAAKDYAVYLTRALGGVVRMMGDGDRMIRRVAVAAGAGSDSWADALMHHADAFVTGELRHHHALALVDAGAVGFECGHFATEAPGIMALADALQNHLHALQYKVSVSKSQVRAYAAPCAPVDREV